MRSERSLGTFRQSNSFTGIRDMDVKVLELNFHVLLTVHIGIILAGKACILDGHLTQSDIYQTLY
jgi:hypothetical protein